MSKTAHPADQPAIRERIRQIIDEKFNGTQGDLADRAGIQRAAISMILSGRSDASAKQLRKIELASRARFEWLVAGVEPVYHPLGWVPIQQEPQKEGDFFKQFITSHKNVFSQARLAFALGVAPSVITDYFKTTTFDTRTRDAIVKGIRLVMGDDTITDANVFSGTETFTQASAEMGLQMRPLGNMSAEPVVELPFVPIRARAGLPTAAFWEQQPETTRIMRATLLEVEPNPSKPKFTWWVIEIDGDSMEPQLVTRAKVLAYYVQLENVTDLKPGIWAIQYDDDFVVKRIRANNYEKEKGVLCHSDNPPPDPFFVRSDQIRHVWYIVKVIDSPVR